MRITPIAASVATSLLLLSGAANATVTLTGADLTQDQAWRIAQGEEVAISKKAMKQVTDSNRLVMAAARAGVEIYGLTVGVGLNKDHHLFDAKGDLTPEVRKASIEFNRNILRSHSVGYGPALSKEVTRLAMVVRLNTMLTGRSGAQPRVVELYRDFLNKGVTPVVPTRGSIGDADITLASHIGSVMMGEWRAEVDGKVVSGAEALKMKGITPLVPEGKDGLGILSSNCVGVAMTMDAMRTMRQALKVSPIVYGLTLEGLNGNVAPFLAQTVNNHPLTGLKEAAAEMRATLKGSYLWNFDKTRALQDPLSFRVTVYGLSEAKRALKDLNEQITVQINSTDDNPATVLNASEEYRKESSQVAKYFVDGDGVKGGIFPSGNFNPLPVALALQRTSLAMAHLSHYSVQRTIHLSYDQFTGLTRFLSDPDNHGHAFGAIQKAFMGLHVDNMALAQPVSLYGMPVAGEIEDTFTNILQAAKRLNTIDENLFQIYSLEMLHSAQAIDLRRMLKNKDLKLSTPTEGLYKAYRKIVPYVKNDRIFTEDIKNGAELLRTYNLKK